MKKFNIKKNNGLLTLVLAYISLHSLIYVNNLSNNKYIIGSFITLGFYILIVILYKKYLNFKLHDSKKNIFWLFIVFSIFLAFTYVEGYNLTVFDDSYLDKPITYYYLFSISMFIYAIFNFIYAKKDKIVSKSYTFKIDCIDKFLFNKHTFIKVFVLIIIAWLPVLLAFYPGIFSYDSSVQFREYTTNMLTNANPVSHTLIVGTCLTIGHNLFNSYNTGVLIYSIFQTIILSATLSYIVSYLNKRKLPFIYKLIVLLLFMFLPTHSVLAVTTTKDVMFACIISLLMIKTYDLTVHTDEFFGKNKIRNIIIYILIASVSFIIRHNGLYGYLFLSMFLLIGLRKHIVPVLICVIVPFVLYSCYTKLINTYLLETKYSNTASTQHVALCVPVQQMARVYNYAHLTKSEIAEFDRFGNLGDKGNGFKNYQVRKSDGVMWSIEPNKFLNENSSDFIKTYLKYFGKYPKLYADAFMQNILGYFYVDDQLPDATAYRTYIEVRSRDDLGNTNNEIKFESKIPALHNIYYDMAEKGTFQDIPVLSTFMSNAFYNLFMLFIILLYTFKKKFKHVIMYMLPVGLMLTNLLGPVALLRYCYYLYLIFPVMLISLHDVISETNKK